MERIEHRTANQLFHRMIASAHKQGLGEPHMLQRTIIGIDPGETTGFAYYIPELDKFTLTMMQIPTKDRNEGADLIEDQIKLAKHLGPSVTQRPIIVCEDYRVYGHKTDQHAWAGLHTPKLIGHIERIAYKLGIPMVFPMAIEAKSWADDPKLKQWDLYEPGMRHARDACRHVVTRAFYGKDPL